MPVAANGTTEELSFAAGGVLDAGLSFAASENGGVAGAFSAEAELSGVGVVGSVLVLCVPFSSGKAAGASDAPAEEGPAAVLTIRAWPGD